MAIPRFNFGSGSSGLYNPNQILVPTTLTSSDKTQLLDYDKRIADYKAQVDAYNKAVEDHNESGKGTFSQKEPTDPGITQEEIDTFGTESAARAQQLQTARQNALNIIQNPEGFSSYYGIGSLGFEEGGEVPVNFVGTGEFPETDPSVGYRTGPASQNKELPLAAELLVDFTPVVGDVKAGIEAADYFNKGEYGNAALAGVGVLPFIPPLAGIVKKSASNSYREMFGDEAKKVIREDAENFAKELKKFGFQAEVTHSGSKLGPSSYVKVFDPQTGRFFNDPFRFSNHSKGSFQHQFVIDAFDSSDINKFVDLAKKQLRAKGPTEFWKKSKGFEEGGAVGEGIGSLMQDNRHQEAKGFGLDYAEDAERYNYREELEQLNPSFRVGRYNIRPNISGSYNMSSVDIPENVDGKNVFINRRYKSGVGNLGFNVTT